MRPSSPAAPCAVTSTLVHGGATVLFRADADVAGMVELFRVPAAGGAAPVRLNGPLSVVQILGRITAVRASADGRRILYTERVSSSGDGTHDELFSRSLASGAPPGRERVPRAPRGLFLPL